TRLHVIVKGDLAENRSSTTRRLGAAERRPRPCAQRRVPKQTARCAVIRRCGSSLLPADGGIPRWTPDGFDGRMPGWKDDATRARTMEPHERPGGQEAPARWRAAGSIRGASSLRRYLPRLGDGVWRWPTRDGEGGRRFAWIHHVGGRPRRAWGGDRDDEVGHAAGAGRHAGGSRHLRRGRRVWDRRL